MSCERVLIKWTWVGMMLTSSEEDSRHLGDEQGESDADGCQERSLVLLRSEEEDGDDELGCQEHLND